MHHGQWEKFKKKIYKQRFRKHACLIYTPSNYFAYYEIDEPATLRYLYVSHANKEITLLHRSYVSLGSGFVEHIRSPEHRVYTTLIDYPKGIVQFHANLSSSS